MTQKSDSPTIGLSMIVKNEEKVILRCLESCYHILDHYTVVDTGCSDSTIELIKSFFESRGIKGEVWYHPFINFEDARNYALNKSKYYTDYSFMISASNILNTAKEFDLGILRKELLKGDVGTMQVDTGSDEVYAQLSFWKNDKPFYFFGATHEVLMCHEPYSTISVSNLSVKLNNDGKSWDDTKIKFQRNIKLLHDYIDKNGMEPRHTFYLAQSYKDAGEYKKAIEWYEKRLEVEGGFYEELYYSQLMIAGLKWEMNYPIMEIADEYMRCGELDTLRAEHLYHLARMYARNNRPQCALKIEEIRSKYKNPYPDRHLFLNPKAYQQTNISKNENILFQLSN